MNTKLVELKGIQGFIKYCKFAKNINGKILQDILLDKSWKGKYAYLKRTIYGERIFLLKNMQNFIGLVCVIPKTGNGISCIFILTEYRGKGFGEIFLRLVNERVGKMWLRTSVDGLKKICKKAGMKHTVQIIDVFEV